MSKLRKEKKKLDLEISFGNHRAQFIIGMREYTSMSVQKKCIESIMSHYHIDLLHRSVCYISSY